MGFGKDHPPKPFTCEWYKLHPQFGQCPDEVPGADITSWILGITIVLLISSFVFFKMYPKKRVMMSELFSSFLALGVLVVMLVMFKKRKV